MGIKIDIHLISMEMNVLGKELKYQSKGGRILFLGLITGLICRHFEVLDWSVFTILLAATAACLLWDGITFLIYRQKVKKEMTKQRYIVKKSDEDKCLHVEDEGETYLLICEDLAIWSKYVKFADSPLVTKSTLYPVTIDEINTLVDNCNHAGLAVLEDGKYVFRYLN